MDRYWMEISEDQKRLVVRDTITGDELADLTLEACSHTGSWATASIELAGRSFHDERLFEEIGFMYLTAARMMRRHGR